jgi:hypothetical protein
MPELSLISVHSAAAVKLVPRQTFGKIQAVLFPQ